MIARLTYFRVALALAGAAVLICGVLFELRWLAAAGLAASAFSELVGLILVRLPANTPALRLMQGLSDALPAIGVAVLLPWALLVAVASVLRALVSGAIETVLLSRGKDARAGNDVSRVFLASLANLAVLGAAVTVIRPDLVGDWPGQRWLVAAIGLALLAAVQAMFRDWLALRRR